MWLHSAAAVLLITQRATGLCAANGRTARLRRVTPDGHRHRVGTFDCETASSGL
jgi:hypothetical protein